MCTTTHTRSSKFQESFGQVDSHQNRYGDLHKLRFLPLFAADNEPSDDIRRYPQTFRGRFRSKAPSSHVEHIGLVTCAGAGRSDSR